MFDDLICFETFLIPANHLMGRSGSLKLQVGKYHMFSHMDRGDMPAGLIYGGYALVNVTITMENDHFQCET